MSELSGFFTTSGSPSGDQQASYTQAQLAIAHKIMAACSNFEGIAPSFLNELSVTATGANTVTMAEGGAMVDGLWYYNDSPQNINIPSAAAGLTRIDRIVLRADWGGFNVSAHRIAGTDHANPTPPAITQTSGTTYDILCVQVEVDDAGNCTVTGEKTFAAAPVDGVTLEESGGSLRIKDSGITAAKIANDAVTTAKIANRTRKLFVPAIPYGTAVAGGSGVNFADASSDNALGVFAVPSDFASNMTVKGVVWAGGTGNAVLNNAASYGAAGQAKDTHSAALVTQVTALTVNLLTEVLTLTLADAAAGDYVRMSFGRSGTHGSDTISASIFFYGWLVEYTADS